jgi:CoA:oxalate CoA-transferase
MAQVAHILDGVRVLDFTQVLAGPTTTRLMAEMGAEVIKVELAPGGDGGRYMPYLRNGRSGYFIQQNRGKRSLCVNRKDERAIALLRALVGKVDVMVENFAPGAIERMGFGWDAVSAINPRLIMASVSAFGQTGALASLPGYDYIAAAYAGVLDMIGEADGPPYFATVGIGDVMTGVHALAAINGALFHRERTGRGQHVATSLLEAYFHCHEINVHAYSASGGAVQPRRSGSHHYAGAPCGMYKVGEGYVFIVCLDNQWPNMCEAMGRPELVADPHFASNGARVANREMVNGLIDGYLAQFKTPYEASEAMAVARVPVAPILSVAEAMHHPHLIENHIVRMIDDPVYGSFQVPGMPLHFSDDPGGLVLTAEYLGQSNGAVLREFLGMSDGDIAGLERDGVLVAKPDLDLATA